MIFFLLFLIFFKTFCLFQSGSLEAAKPKTKPVHAAKPKAKAKAKAPPAHAGHAGHAAGHPGGHPGGKKGAPINHENLIKAVKANVQHLEDNGIKLSAQGHAHMKTLFDAAQKHHEGHKFDEEEQMKIQHAMVGVQLTFTEALSKAAAAEAAGDNKAFDEEMEEIEHVMKTNFSFGTFLLSSILVLILSGR